MNQIDWFRLFMLCVGAALTLITFVICFVALWLVS